MQALRIIGVAVECPHCRTSVYGTDGASMRVCRCCGGAIELPTAVADLFDPQRVRITDTKRMQAAWECCEGVPTEQLRPGLLKMLVDAVAEEDTETEVAVVAPWIGAPLVPEGVGGLEDLQIDLSPEGIDALGDGTEEA